MAFLEVEDLRVTFRAPDGKGRLKAVQGVSFSLAKGESLGLVGESGCGKTTVGNAIMRLVPISGGRVTLSGRDTQALRGDALRAYRREVQMVFQDPLGSLNPRMTVGAAILEVLRVHNVRPPAAAEGGEPLGARAVRQWRRDRVLELLDMVGLDPTYASHYPHEFSGGQRQRIGIARALSLAPDLVVADEPVSALDVSVQVQILNLMRDLQEKMGLSYLFIAHDLAVVRYTCRRALVMYLGRIVESATTDELFTRPAHPYTEALLSAVPDVDRGLQSRVRGSSRIVLKGDVPSPVEAIPGCPFHTRCHRARPLCSTQAPPWQSVGEARFSACHFARELLG